MKDCICKTAGVCDRRHPTIVSTGQDDVQKGGVGLLSALFALSLGQLVRLQAWRGAGWVWKPILELQRTGSDVEMPLISSGMWGRKQEEHSGKGSTMDAEQGKRQQQVFTLKDQHAVTPHFSLSLMNKYLFNAKTFWWADINTIVKILLPLKKNNKKKKYRNVTIFHSYEIKQNNTSECCHAWPFVWKESGLQIFVKEIPHGWHRQDEMKAPAGTDWRWCVGTGLSHVPWDKARAKPTDFPSNQPLTKGSPFQPTKLL